MELLSKVREAYYRYVDKKQEEYFELLKKITEIKAPTFFEKERSIFILDLVRGWGFSSAFLSDISSVIINLSEEAPEYVFMAHLDTVFENAVPVNVTDDGERLYAPGIGDDTANVCALLFFMKFMVDECPELVKYLEDKRVMIALDVCEEGLGNLIGAREIFDKYVDKSKVKAVISYDVGYDNITNVAVGSKRYKISISTEGGHSYWDYGRPNAIHYMAKLIDRLYEEPMPEVGATNRNIHMTQNVGVIKGGISVNTIASDTEILYEYRTDNDECMALLDERFEKIINDFQHESDYGRSRVKMNVELIGERPSMGKPDSEYMDKLSRMAQNIIKEHSGLTPEFISGSTDCNIPLSMNIPAISFGVYLGKGMHTKEEYIEKSSINAGLKILFDTLINTIRL